MKRITQWKRENNYSLDGEFYFSNKMRNIKILNLSCHRIIDTRRRMNTNGL
jgi:hypothetical protein